MSFRFPAARPGWPTQAAGLTCLLGLAAPAAAQPLGGVLSDVRAGVLYHDVPILGIQRERGVDLNAEAVFVSPVAAGFAADLSPFLRWFLHPQPDVGVDANLQGYTSQIYAGLVWVTDIDSPLRPHRAMFASIGFGGAYNTGRVNDPQGDHLSLGSNLLLHASLELGYRLTPTWSVSVYSEHRSNAGLATNNAGLDNLGVRAGVHF